MAETSNDRQKRYTSSKAQNLIKDHGDFLSALISETVKEFELPINEVTAEAIGLAYAKQMSAKQALNLFMKKLYSKADDRN